MKKRNRTGASRAGSYFRKTALRAGFAMKEVGEISRDRSAAMGAVIAAIQVATLFSGAARRQRRQFAELRQARNELCRSRADSKKAVTGFGAR